MQKNVAISSSISDGVVSSNSFFLDSDSSSNTTTTALDDHRRRLYHTLLVQDHQEMVNRRSLCLNRLREVNAEATALRRENGHLRSLNVELNKQLRLVIQSTLVQNRLGSSTSMYRDKCFGTGFWSGEEGDSQIRRSVIESRGADENVELHNIYSSRLPKSISVKSDDYLNIKAQGIVNNGGRTSRDSIRSRTITLQNAKQKVYVGGGKKENHGHEDQVEVEVHKQGAYKTELCNKWQETGECPYGDHCQFAHGIDQLRPVIRHPRYKTQVCRMVLNGIVCPYGHRCHFLHALADHKVK